MESAKSWYNISAQLKGTLTEAHRLIVWCRPPVADLDMQSAKCVHGWGITRGWRIWVKRDFFFIAALSSGATCTEVNSLYWVYESGKKKIKYLIIWKVAGHPCKGTKYCEMCCVTRNRSNVRKQTPEQVALQRKHPFHSCHGENDMRFSYVNDSSQLNPTARRF